MNSPIGIFLDPKVKNVTVRELENGEKAINWSSNFKLKHGWSCLKASGTRKKCAKFEIQYIHKLGDIHFSRIWRALRELIDFRILILCA